MTHSGSDHSVLYISLPFIGSTASFIAMFVVIATSAAMMMG